MQQEQPDMDILDMDAGDFGFASKRIQSLVFHCQRVAASHLDAIDSFAGLPFKIVSPILESCTAQQLLRFEEDLPEMREDTTEIWKKVCLRQFPAAAEQYDSHEREEPTSWREEYFVLQQAEARRLEEVASRLRSKRQGDEERKEEKKAKLIDRKPPAKRPRWGLTSQPKTLMGAARTKASLAAKNAQHVLNNPRGTTTIPNAPGTRVPVLQTTSRPSSASNPSDPLAPLASTIGSVSATVVRRPVLPTMASTLSPFSSCPSSTFRAANPTRRNTFPTSSPEQSTPVAQPPPTIVARVTTLTPSLSRLVMSTPARAAPASLLEAPSRAQGGSASTRTDVSVRPPKPPPPKKDKGSALFMPKHRAYSQLPAQAREVPSR